MESCDISLDRNVIDYIKNFKNAADVEEFLRDSLGSSKQLPRFSKDFLALMTEEAQSESPRPASSKPGTPVMQQGSKCKKKKAKAVVDPSLLGFSVRSNRIMQGSIDRGEE
eukprot:GHVS01056069.1.p1 GENE.GHVS01056069.1~~GHVS01056069.1.p1  ORF type:complete len:111 (-),score=19.11 GHVS01056069.1:48-380(-)